MISLSRRIPIFPLGEVVLFPDTLLPLRIFEPRYRKMLADALESDKTIGMVLLKGEDAGAGQPEVYPVGCAGCIVKHEPASDGRSLIVLEGTVRFRISHEPDSGEPYRIVEPQALYEAPAPMEEVRGWRDELRLRLKTLVEVTEGDERVIDKLFSRLDLMAMVNTLSASLPLSTLEKQSLLECPTVESRFERLIELLEFKVAEARLGLDSDRHADA